MKALQLDLAVATHVPELGDLRMRLTMAEEGREKPCTCALTALLEVSGAAGLPAHQPDHTEAVINQLHALLRILSTSPDRLRGSHTIPPMSVHHNLDCNPMVGRLSN